MKNTYYFPNTLHRPCSSATESKMPLTGAGNKSFRKISFKWNQRLKDPLWKPWSTKDSNITFSDLQWALICPFRKPDFRRKGAAAINLVLLESLAKTKQNLTNHVSINSFMLITMLIINFSGCYYPNKLKHYNKGKKRRSCEPEKSRCKQMDRKKTWISVALNNHR